MQKQKSGYGFLIFLLLLIIIAIGIFMAAPDPMKKNLLDGLRETGRSFIPRLVNAITAPLYSIGASIGVFFSSFSLR